MSEARLDVLLIEDDADHAEILRYYFEAIRPGTRIEHIEDGAEARVRLGALGQNASARLPDIVVLDLKLPKVDGHQVIAALRAIPRLADLPVVVCSTSQASSDVRRAFELGATALVPKPLEPEGFDGAVRRLLEIADAASKRGAC